MANVSAAPSSARVRWTDRAVWALLAVLFLFAGVILTPGWRLGLAVLGGVAALMALAKTRGRGIGSGIACGIAVGVAVILSLWYFNTHNLTLTGAILIGSVVIAAGGVVGAFVTRGRFSR